MPNAKKQALKRTVKFLCLCKKPQVVCQIISKSPDSLIKCICNAAQGEVLLSKKAKKLLSSHRNFIARLVKKGDSVHKKRKILCQSGNNITGLVIPPLLGTVLASLGSAFI